MSGIPSRNYGQLGNKLQADVSRSLHGLEGEVAEARAYSPAAPGDWDGSPPSTVRQALDRLAAAYRAQHGPVP